MRTQSLAMLLFLAVNLFFGAGESWAQIVTLSRESNYLINSDGSYEYEIDLWLENNNAIYTDYIAGDFFILPQAIGSIVKPTGFTGNDFFRYYGQGEVPFSYDFSTINEFGITPLSKNFLVDGYNYYVEIPKQTQKHIMISYSGARETLAGGSSNSNLPYSDQADVNGQYGYWEFVGGGSWISSAVNYTVNVALPETVVPGSVKLLGYDGNVSSSDGRFFQFTSSDVSKLDVNLAFKTTAPLSPSAVTPEPLSSALFLLGGALLGVGTLRKKK